MSNALVENNGTNRTALAVGQRGLELRTLDEMWRFADIVHKSGCAPKGMESAAKLFIAIEMGAELGLPPMAAIQNIAVINGRPSVWGDAMLAVCRGGGCFCEASFDESMTGSGDTLLASCSVRRLPGGKIQTRSFSVAQAKRAGLWGKDTWAKYPERMLQMRARGFALRDVFPDHLRGCQMAEELIGTVAEPVSNEPKPMPVAVDSLDVLAERISGEPIEIEPPAEEECVVPEPETLANLVAEFKTLTGIREVEAAYDAACGPLGYLDGDEASLARISADKRIEEIRAARGGKQQTLA